MSWPDILRGFIQNLNALKFTPAGGQVTLSAGLQANWPGRGAVLLCSVADTGIGIPPQDLLHVFERFYRVDKARARELGGSGLGLSIVETIVEAHGGEVGVESQSGQGTRFWFTLPIQ